MVPPYRKYCFVLPLSHKKFTILGTKFAPIATPVMTQTNVKGIPYEDLLAIRYGIPLAQGSIKGQQDVIVLYNNIEG